MKPISVWGDHVDVSPLPRATLKDTTEVLIRRALLSGAMRPGQIYSANSLATQLGVSNSPAREAMMSLAGKGLLEVVRNRGFRVVEMTDRDKQEVYDLRMLIEVEAVRRVAGAGVDEATAQRMRTLTEDTVASAHSEDIVDYLEADQLYHARLVDLLGNSRWTAIVENLRDQSRITDFYHHLKENGRLEDSAAEHRGITEAVVAGDPERAAELMIRHLDYARP